MIYVTFDLETSGLNVNSDHIMQIAMILSDDNFNTIKEYCHLINPECEFEVNPGAFEKTGISKEMVQESGVPFSKAINDIQNMLNEADVLVSYNGNKFDIPFLYNEFARFGKSLKLPNVVIDSLSIEQKHNSNKLVDAYKRYYGEEYEDAHDALADVKATIAVFKKQKELYEDAMDDSDFISPENMLTWDISLDRLVFKTGKYKDKSVYEICKTDAGYINWLFKSYNGNGCSGFMKVAIQNEYNRVKTLANTTSTSTVSSNVSKF